MKGTFDLLVAINTTLLGGRWTDEDLAQLTAPHLAVVSGFESVRRDLAAILEKDLGNTPPDPTTTGSGAS